MKKYLFFSILALFISGCGRLQITSTPTISPTPFIESPTLTPGISILPTVVGVDQYTQDLHDRIKSCVVFRDVYDFTFEGELINPSLGTRKFRECLDFVHQLEMPADCEGCEELVPLLEGFSNRTLESLQLIDDGYELQKPFLIAEGLTTFWDVDLFWDAIRLTIDRIRAKHDLPEIN